VPRIFDDVAPSESDESVLLIETAAGFAAAIAERQREANLALKEKVLRQAREPQKRLTEELARQQRQRRASVRAFRRSAILRHRLRRGTDTCRWPRARGSISARAPRGRVARRLTPSRDGPHRRRRSSDDDRPVARLTRPASCRTSRLRISSRPSLCRARAEVREGRASVA
jgi:hypothetical protein